MFLPEDYEAPMSPNSSYMRLQKGENRIRILSQPILGWEDWTLDKKPIRFRYDKRPDKSIDPKKPIKHFWAMIVWNYAVEQIQILQITQATVRKSLEKLCKDADWGLPYFYDIKITKEGEGKDTEYSVNPIPAKPLAPHIKQAFEDRPCNLEALFTNQDPFGIWTDFTPGIFSKEDVKDESPKKACIKKEQAEELQAILKQCDQKYQDSVWNALHKNSISDLKDLPIEMYDRIKNAAMKKAEDNKKQEIDWILDEAQ